MKLRCPAKINLLLELLGKRPDGYHEIRTIYQSVDFVDELELTLCPGNRLKLTLRAGRMAVPAGEDNLVQRAYNAFHRAHGPVPGLSAILTKRIPPGSGLGGGSSNAASMLLALRSICGGPGFSELKVLAGGLGSDVPFFLHGGTAEGRGRGDRVSPLPDAAKQLVLLILPETMISTQVVYQSCSPILTRAPNRNSIHRYLSEGGEVCLQRDFQGNDLESVVFRMEPQLGQLKDLLYATGAGFASLSGSGSALFGLYDSEALAVQAAGRFDAYPCRTVVTRFLGRKACEVLGEGLV